MVDAQPFSPSGQGDETGELLRLIRGRYSGFLGDQLFNLGQTSPSLAALPPILPIGLASTVDAASVGTKVLGASVDMAIASVCGHGPAPFDKRIRGYLQGRENGPPDKAGGIQGAVFDFFSGAHRHLSQKTQPGAARRSLRRRALPSYVLVV